MSKEKYLGKNTLSKVFKLIKNSLSLKEDLMDEVSTDEMKSIWSDINKPPVKYTITDPFATLYPLTDVQYLTINKSEACAGENVTVSWGIADSSLNKDHMWLKVSTSTKTIVQVKASAPSGSYTFVMPESNVQLFVISDSNITDSDIIEQ